ncbi:hypothetical protein ES708_35167 [subsurface metagenome]
MLNPTSIYFMVSTPSAVLSLMGILEPDNIFASLPSKVSTLGLDKILVLPSVCKALKVVSIKPLLSKEPPRVISPKVI